MIPRIFCLATTALLAAGCATQQPGSTGPHLVYWDAAGNAVRQFDYPSADFCRTVEKVADGARCRPSGAAGLAAKATLRYNPPGVLVHARYSDLARCQSETAQLGAGVELIQACAAN